MSHPDRPLAVYIDGVRYIPADTGRGSDRLENDTYVLHPATAHPRAGAYTNPDHPPPDHVRAVHNGRGRIFERWSGFTGHVDMWRDTDGTASTETWSDLIRREHRVWPHDPAERSHR